MTKRFWVLGLMCPFAASEASWLTCRLLRAARFGRMRPRSLGRLLPLPLPPMLGLEPGARRAKRIPEGKVVAVGVPGATRTLTTEFEEAPPWGERPVRWCEEAPPVVVEGETREALEVLEALEWECLWPLVIMVVVVVPWLLVVVVVDW